MEPINSEISEKCIIYKDVFIRDSRIGEATLSDRAVLLSSTVADKAVIGRGCVVVYSLEL